MEWCSAVIRLVSISNNFTTPSVYLRWLVMMLIMQLILCNICYNNHNDRICKAYTNNNTNNKNTDNWNISNEYEYKTPIMHTAMLFFHHIIWVIKEIMLNNFSYFSKLIMMMEENRTPSLEVMSHYVFSI